MVAAIDTGLAQPRIVLIRNRVLHWGGIGFDGGFHRRQVRDLGHSERRAYYGNPEILKEKVKLALANGLTPSLHR